MANTHWRFFFCTLYEGLPPAQKQGKLTHYLKMARRLDLFYILSSPWFLCVPPLNRNCLKAHFTIPSALLIPSPYCPPSHKTTSHWIAGLAVVSVCYILQTWPPLSLPHGPCRQSSRYWQPKVPGWSPHKSLILLSKRFSASASFILWPIVLQFTSRFPAVHVTLKSQRQYVRLTHIHLVVPVDSCQLPPTNFISGL